MRKALLFLFPLLLFGRLQAQEPEKVSQWQLNGYIKNLTTINVLNDSSLVDHLLHHRLNLKWFASEKLTATFEVRTRFFAGDLVKSIPNYRRFIDVNNDYLDLSVDFSNSQNTWLFHSMIDRAYLEYYADDWEIRLGRQRINWGVNLVWNPNDLFNAYSFFDFDYEERPGSDALRVKRYFGFASSLEVAVNAAENFDDMVMAGLWKTNKWNYDFQFQMGKARRDLVIGGGWAGNIGNAGFKGELTYFHPYTNRAFLDPAFLFSLSADYSFENSLYLNTSFLFNSDGTTNPQQSLQFGNAEPLTARNLSPFKYSTFVQLGYQISPVIGGGFSTIFYPGQRNALFINPSLTFSLFPNFDLDVISQVYFDQSQGEYQAQARLFYFRLKWSY